MQFPRDSEQRRGNTVLVQENLTMYLTILRMAQFYRGRSDRGDIVLYSGQVEARTFYCC
jgi:hypothetical protein